jgi:putative spermidine/putrescine transport system substrate-binding protein
MPNLVDPATPELARRGFTRRDALRAGSALLVVPSVPWLLAACNQANDKPKELVFSTFSGPFEKATRATVVPCFEKATGITAQLVVGTPAANLAKIQANRDNPPMAVFVGLQESTYQAIDSGLAEKLDFGKLPNAKDIPKQFIDPFDGYGISFNSGSWGLAYDKTKVANPPKSWKEFVERTIKGDFGKNVGMPGVPTYPHIVVWQTINAYGKKLDQEGIDLAFEKFKAMRPYIAKIWSQLSEPGTLLSSGEVAITPLNDGRTYGVIDGGAKNVEFTRLEEGAIATTGDLVKVKGTSPYAYEFMNCFLDPEVQSGFAKFFPGYFFTNPKVKYPPEAEGRVPKREQLLFPPAREIAKIAPALIERWNKELAA